MESHQATPSPSLGHGDPECPQCGTAAVRTLAHRHTFTYGSDKSGVELTVDVPLRRCTSCDFQYLDQEAERLKHEAVCQHFGVLSPGEIRRIRESYGMTRAKFAEVTGLGEASLNRWENGLTIQTQGNDRYIRLVALPGIMKHLEDLADGGSLSRPVSTAVTRPFRTLEVTEAMRRDQAHFRLRPAA